jgi:hypothetical protein
VSYRIFSVGQAIKTLSSLQFSSFTAGRGTISILGETGATGIFGITNPFSIAGSPTEATLATEPDGVSFAVRPWSIADGARADAAGALGCGPALLGTPAPGMPKNAARPRGATLAPALEEAAGLRTGAGVRPRGSCGG